MEKFIDIEKILKDKNPKLAKWIPRFIVNYLKRIFHQEEINKILDENKNLDSYEFCQDIVKRFDIEIESFGIEKIPAEGGVIFVMNHPLGGFDALVVVNEIWPVRTDIKFIVNDVLLNIKNINNLVVGVNKLGASSKESMLKVNELFASDQAVFIFPAGLVSRRSKKRVRDLEWKKTFVARAKKYERIVIPVFIDGELSSFFYRLSNMRKGVGIKKNIEMLYLANETFKLKSRKFSITIGDPIPHTKFDKSKKDIEWAQWVKEEVYKLKKNTDKDV